MSTARAYRPRRRERAVPDTRERIAAAVRELLEEGAFHEATVEEVAERAGVARATLYVHFGSRLGLVDAICETFGRSPELQAVKQAVEHPDAVRALEETIRNSARFWARHENVLVPLYGVAAVDPAAGRLVERQLNDRKSVLTGLVRRLRGADVLRAGLTERKAVGILLVLTSLDTFLQLRRHAGLTERAVAGELAGSARALLL